MKKLEIKQEIEEILLEFANLFNEVTTSDLQGIATVKAEEIINLMSEKTRYVIKFQDGDTVCTYRHDDGNGEDMIFNTREEAQKYLDTLDSREFNRWIAKRII